jgi:hypothetical protein
MTPEPKAATAGGMATISVRVVMDSPWNTGADSAAVGEIVPTPGKRTTRIPKRTFSVGINSGPQQLRVAPGEYTVRLFLPNGEIIAESVSPLADTQEEVKFELRRSPHEWLGAEAVYGSIQWLPSRERARALESVRSAPDDLLDEFAGQTVHGLDVLAVPAAMQSQRDNVRALVAQAVTDVDASFAAVKRISGLSRVPKIAGWRWLSRIDRERALPAERLKPIDLVRWWTGEREAAPVALEIALHDERNAKLVTAASNVIHSSALISGERRAFAAMKDPAGGAYYAVYPEGWVRTSRSALGTPAAASVLMTVVIDTVLRAADETSAAARWRCAASVDDVEAMTLLGFLGSGQTAAAGVLLQQAQDFLFEKTVNPVAAAAGAFGLLTYSEETNARERPHWRQWIHNLYSWFPRLPDGAIAMAKMYLKFGEGATAEELDVERLRGYALEAVRRGLPYLSFGIHTLLEILLMLVRDDEAQKRAGAEIEQTRRAHALVQQLSRIVAPGGFFTVLRLDERVR